MFDCGDVLIVPVPLSDLTATKQRPVIVVTPQSYREEANGDFREDKSETRISKSVANSNDQIANNPFRIA